MNLTKLETNPLVQAIGIRALKVHQEIYERSGGRVGTGSPGPGTSCCGRSARRPVTLASTP
jgi:hypothetical protein